MDESKLRSSKASASARLASTRRLDAVVSSTRDSADHLAAAYPDHAASSATGVVHAGRLAVEHEDGTEIELSPGDAYVIESGHDAWVVGDQPFVGFEFESRSAEDYARG